MNAQLVDYLWNAYRHDILGEPIKVEKPELTPELLADAKLELARIDSLRLGASLASRDFPSYHRRKALTALLES